MIELVVASALFIVLFYVTVGMFKNIVQTSTQTRQRLDASAYTKEIGEQLKTIPFDDLYAMDSAMKHPASYRLPGIGNYYDNDHVFREFEDIYYLDWDLSLSSPTFYGIEREVLKRGFSRFSVQVTRMVSPNTTTYWGTAWTRVWCPEQHFTKLMNCDREVQTLCYKDLDGDGKYWSRGETPQVDMKEVVVKLYDQRGRVAQTETFFHSSSVLSPRNTYSNKDPLSLKISFGASARLTRGSPEIKEHLEYKSLYGWDWFNTLYQYHSNNGRSRTGDLAMIVNQSKLHESTPDALVHWDSTGDLGSFVLQVETPLTGEIQVFPFISDSAPYPFNSNVKEHPGTTPFVTIPLGRQAQSPRDNVFFLDHTNDWKRVQDAFHNDAWLKDNDTLAYVILRKVVRNKFNVVVSSSALFYSWVYWDVHPPVVSTAPVPGNYTVGLNPLLQVGVNEPWDDSNPGSHMHGYEGSQSFLKDYFAFIIEKDNGFGFVQIATAMWSGEGDGTTKPYSVSYRNRAEIDAHGWYMENFWVDLRLVDQDELPAVLPDYGKYRITCEFADAHVLKSSHTWVSEFNPGVGASTFNVDVSTFVGPWGTFVANEDNKATNPTVVPFGTTVNLGAIQLWGTDWGIKWKSVKVEDCNANNFAEPCTDVLSFGGPNPGNLQYGLYFNFGTPDSPKTRFSDKATHSFKKLGYRVIRITLETWKDNTEITLPVWYLNVI